MGRDLSMGLGLGVGGMGLYQLTKLLLSGGGSKAEQPVETPNIHVRKHTKDKIASGGRYRRVAENLFPPSGSAVYPPVDELPPIPVEFQTGPSKKQLLAAAGAGLGGGALANHMISSGTNDDVELGPVSITRSAIKPAVIAALLGLGGYGVYRAMRGKPEPKPEEEQDKSAGLYRLADALRKNRRAVAPHAEKAASIFGAVRAGATGQAAQTVNQLPYGLSARALALLTGLGGGAYLTKRLGAEAKEHALNQELEQARAEFESALNETSSPQTKLATAVSRIEKAATALPDLFPKGLDKQAADALANNLGKALSVYALLALMGAGTAGYYGYKAGVKNQKARRYDMANAARQQRRKIENPYRPVAVLDEDEQAGDAGPLY